MVDKETLKNKLLAEKEIVFNKLKNRYTSEFKFLNITSNNGMQERLYEYCYGVKDNKCANPNCINETSFIKFKNGYRATCSRRCSNIVKPRGRQGKKYQIISNNFSYNLNNI